MPTSTFAILCKLLRQEFYSILFYSLTAASKMINDISFHAFLKSRYFILVPCLNQSNLDINQMDNKSLEGATLF